MSCLGGEAPFLERIGLRKSSFSQIGSFASMYGEDLAKGLNQGKKIDAVLLDLSKAFNKVHHQHLLDKLRHNGVPDNLNRWVQDFLAYRQQAVVLEGVHSKSTNVTVYHRKQSLGQFSFSSTSMICKRMSRPPPDRLQMVPWSIGSSSQRKIIPFYKKTLTSCRIGRVSG